MGLDGVRKVQTCYVADSFNSNNNETRSYATSPIQKQQTTQTLSDNPAKDVQADLGADFGNTAADAAATTEETQAAEQAQGTAQTQAATDENAKKDEAAKDYGFPTTLTNRMQSEEAIKENIMFEGNNAQLTTQRKYATEEDRKAAIEEVTNDFLKYGRADGTKVTDKKEAQKLAEDHVRNNAYNEGIYSTRTCATQEELDAANKEQKEAKDSHYKELREQGLSRHKSKKMTKEWAKQNLVHNDMVTNKDALKYMNDHKDYFYNEDGTINQVHYKQYVDALTNTHTQEGEDRNGFLSLKERREASAETGLSTRAALDMVNSGSDEKDYGDRNTEKDYTTAKQIGIIGGSALLVAGALAPVVISATTWAGSAAASGAGSTLASAGSTAVATAGATAKVYGVGSTIGGAATLTAGSLLKDNKFFRDNGGSERASYSPAQPKQDPEAPAAPAKQEETTNQAQEVQAPVQEEIQEETCETRVTESCDHVVKRNEGWSNITSAVVSLNGKPLSGNMLRAYVHALKLKHGITDFTKNTAPKVGQVMRLYSDFGDITSNDELVKKYPELSLLNNVQFELNCDGNVKHYTQRPVHNYTRYNGNPTDAVKRNCQDQVVQ